MTERQVLFAGKRFSVERRYQQTPAGPHPRDVVVHPGAVAVLPLLPDDRICLIRNFRVAAEETLLEIPAGTLEPDEPPLETARRELTEETGYRAGRLELLTTFFPSPGVLNERMYLYAATELTAGDAAREAGEEIENAEMTWAEALRLARQGQIRDGKTLVGLLFYEAFRRGERS